MIEYLKFKKGGIGNDWPSRLLNKEKLSAILLLQFA